MSDSKVTIIDKHLEALYSVNLGYKNIGICYNLKEVSNNIISKSIGMENDYTLKEAVEEYVNRKVLKYHRR